MSELKVFIFIIDYYLLFIDTDLSSFFLSFYIYSVHFRY